MREKIYLDNRADKTGKGGERGVVSRSKKKEHDEMRGDLDDLEAKSRKSETRKMKGLSARRGAIVAGVKGKGRSRLFYSKEQV